MTAGRHSELSPVEAQQVHDLSVAAGLRPLVITVDPQFNLEFQGAGGLVFQHLADWCLHAEDLAELRRGGSSGNFAPGALANAKGAERGSP